MDNPLLTNFISEYKELKSLLLEESQLTFQTMLESHLTKTFLLSCASFYENQVYLIIDHILSTHIGDERVICFAITKGIKRQYHTYFNWEDKNINSFLGLFGMDFKNSVSSEIKNSEILVAGMNAFLSIGYERNKMVHENFLAYNLSKTFDEIEVLNNSALTFINFLRSKFCSPST